MDFKPFSYCSRLNPNQCDQINRIRSAVEKIPAAEEVSSRPFNDAERMIEMLESWLIDQEQEDALTRNAWNIFFMIASVYLKDIEREHQSFPAITDNDQILIIDEIIHAVESISEKGIDTHKFCCLDAYGEVRIDLLCAIIALAEQLDLFHDKTLDKIHQHILEPKADTRLQFPKSFSVEDIGPHPDLPATIRIQCKCRDAEVHRALKHYEIAINRFLDHLNRSVRPRFLYVKVIIEIDAQGYEPVDLKFMVDTFAALELFAGNRLYTDKRVFLRELVQNAVDACNLRKIFDPDVPSSIVISFRESENRILVMDNGIGMDRQWLEKYFMNIGISFYRSDEFSDAVGSSDLRFSFISTFGIGFLSTFLVADRIHIRTRKPSGKGLAITIVDFNDYFDIRPLEEDFPIGTEVVLTLKPRRGSVWREMEYLSYLKSNLRFVSVPIHFADEQGNTVTIGSERLDFFDSSPSMRNFPARIHLPNSKGYLLLRTRGGQGSLWDLESSVGGLSIFQDGIFVTQVEYLLPQKAKRYVVGRINLTGADRCTLSMDRNRIFWPEEQLQRFKYAILHSIAVSASRLLEAFEKQNDPSENRRKIIQKIADLFDVTDVDDALYDTLHEQIQGILQQRFRAFLRTSISRLDLVDTDFCLITETHGFHCRWQRRVIDNIARNLHATELGNSAEEST
jgi:Histidine kinase-, DNA gyrase B-, and HSP90-like ATPase